MAKKAPKAATDVIEVPIQFQDDGVETVFANQMIVQSSEHECYLTFYEVRPPMLLGTLDRPENVKAAAKARVVISKARLSVFSEALRSVVDKTVRQDQTEVEQINGK